MSEIHPRFFLQLGLWLGKGWPSCKQMSSHFVVAPKCFHSSHMQGPTPRPGYFEYLLLDDGAMELVGGDDQGQNTAINDELHLSKYLFFILLKIYLIFFWKKWNHLKLNTLCGFCILAKTVMYCTVSNIGKKVLYNSLVIRYLQDTNAKWPLYLWLCLFFYSLFFCATYFSPRFMPVSDIRFLFMVSLQVTLYDFKVSDIGFLPRKVIA